MQDYNRDWCFSVMNAIEDMILVKGDKSKLLWANEAFLKYYGMTNEELANIVDAEHSDPDDTLQYVKDDQYVYENGVKLDIPSEPVTNSKNEIKYFHTVKTPIKDNSGKVKMVVGVSRLIEEDKIIEASKAKRDDRKQHLDFQRDFLSKLGLPIIALDMKNRIVSMSQTAKDYLGNINLNEPNFWENTFEKDFPIIEHFSKGTELIPEIEWYKNGEELFCEILITPLLANEGERVGTLILFRDLTNQILLQRSLEEERQARINSGKLKTLGEVAAGVGHEINNPLAIISGLVQKIEMAYPEATANEDLKNDIASIRQNCDRVAKIVKGLKSLSRDAKNDEMIQVDIRSIIEDALSLSQARFREKQIDIKVTNEDTNDLNIQCRPSEITQVVLNLINNAYDIVKHRDERWVHINSKDLGHDIIIDISDSGPGVSEEIRKKIFNPFFTTKAVGEGTGLGLGISSSIMKQHNGSLRLLENTPNTTFQLKFPRTI